MSEATPAPEQSGVLSIEQAITAIQPQASEPEPTPEPAPVEAAEPEGEGDPDTQSEAVPTAEDESGQDDPVTADEEAESADQGEAPAIEYPRSWAAKDREVFAALPEEARTVILAREDARDRAVSKAQQEASEARKKYDQNAEGVIALKTKLDATLERADATFADRWTNVDWIAWAQQDPASAMAAKFQMEQEQAELTAIRTAQETAAKEEIQKFTRDELQKLPEVAPDLADPKQGQQRRTELARFLLDIGVTREQLPLLSAMEMSIAYDAMQFRRLKAAKPPLKPSAQPTPTVPQRRPVAPTAAPQRDTQTRSIEQLAARLSKTGSEDDAVRLLQARRK